MNCTVAAGASAVERTADVAAEAEIAFAVASVSVGRIVVESAAEAGIGFVGSYLRLQTAYHLETFVLPSVLVAEQFALVLSLAVFRCVLVFRFETAAFQSELAVFPFGPVVSALGVGIACSAEA